MTTAHERLVKMMQDRLAKAEAHNGRLPPGVTKDELVNGDRLRVDAARAMTETQAQAFLDELGEDGR